MAPAKKSEPLFRSRRRQQSPECTFVVRTPVPWTHIHAWRYTRRVVRTCTYDAYYAAPTCGPDLTKSGQMSILNVVQVGAVRRRKPTRCIRASLLHACVRACPHTRARPDSFFGLHVLYRWHRTPSPTNSCCHSSE